VKLGKGFMRFFASIGRQAGLALLRWLLVCAMLAVVSTQSHHAFASEINHETNMSASVEAEADGSHHHSDGACLSAGHCAPVFVGIAPAFSLAAKTWGPAEFISADALPSHGRTVDPGQHPPKTAQLI